MRLIQLLASAALSVVAASCATPPPENDGPQVKPRPEIITKTEYRPGRTVVQPYPQPDSELVSDPPELSTEHITEDDIEPEDAMATAISWAGSYHTVKDKYNTLRGWVAGVAAGTAMVQKALDDANPNAPGVPQAAAEGEPEEIIEDQAP